MVTANEWTADAIRLLRRALGESTTEFGARVGRTRRAVEDWEQGRRTPDVLARREFDLLVKRRKGLADEMERSA